MLLSDIVLLDYKRCNRRPFLDFYGDPSQQDGQREFLSKLRQENHKQVLEVIANQSYHQPQAPVTDWETRGKETMELMEKGVDQILYGAIWQTGLSGWNLPFLVRKEITFLASPTLLIKEPGYSIFGDWQYKAVSIKLGRRPKPEYKLVAAFQAKLLALIQGNDLIHPSLIVKSHQEYQVNMWTWLSRMEEVLAAVLAMLVSRQEPEVFISRQRCNLCQWHSFCYQIAQDTEHLSLLPGVTPTRYDILKSAGITSLETLANTDVSWLKKQFGSEIATNLHQQAKANFREKPILKAASAPSVLKILPTASREIYFDIEAEPERNLDYLLGALIIDYEQGTETFYPLVAESPEEEKEIWQHFLDLVKRDPDAPIFHYSKYEAETIRRLSALYQTSKQEEQLLIKRLVDLHDIVTKFFILPTENYSLKKIAQWLGFQWREEGVSGEECVCWYDQWLKTRDRAFLDPIIRYNEDDCRATYRLKTWLVQFLNATKKSETGR